MMRSGAALWLALAAIPAGCSGSEGTADDAMDVADVADVVTEDGSDVATEDAGEAPADGTTHAAASCAWVDVNAAVQLAAPGDVVDIPPGTCTWNDTLVLDKSLVLRGAGDTSTLLVNGGVDTLVSVEPAADEFVRVTGIAFDAGSYEAPSSANMRSGVWVRGLLHQVRIDHCRFEKGKTAVWWSGGAQGVTDHCTVHNVDLGIRLAGDNDASWNRPIEAGSADAVFIEDNQFLVDGDMPYDPNEQIYHDSWGARTTVRHNGFVGTYGGSVVPIEAHGDWPNPPYHARSVVLLEIYDNSFDIQSTYRMLHFRGGSILVHDNTFVHHGGDTTVIAMTEEASWQTDFFDPLDTEWPAQDQIHNSFFWANTLNGASVTTVTLWHDEDVPFIQEDRDYWMHEPQASGGRTVYTGDPGFDMEYVADSPNAYYPYAPYSYPHPLVLR